MSQKVLPKRVNNRTTFNYTKRKKELEQKRKEIKEKRQNFEYKLMMSELGIEVLEWNISLKR